MSGDGAFAAMQTAIEVVESQRNLMNNRVDGWTVYLKGAMSQLADIKVASVPAPVRPPMPTLPDLTVDTGTRPVFSGTAVSIPSPSPTMDDISGYFAGLDSVVIDEMPNAPEAPAINMPEAPVMVMPSAPVRPSVSGDVAIPVAPVLETPTLDGLVQMPKAYQPNLPAAPDRPQINIDVPMPQAPSLAVQDMGGMRLIPEISVPHMPTAPARPDIDMAVQLPGGPVYDLPQLGALKDIPDFVFPTLPDFDGNPPTLDLATPNVFIDWVEPAYESELMDELVGWVRTSMQGGTGLPAHVEDALFSRSRDRISAETRRGVQESVASFAARGFDMPPGMLAKQVNVLREQGRNQAAELNRDILIEATKWEIENIRFAVERGIATEQLLTNLYENAAKRVFEAARFSAESQITVYNARIGLFNAQVDSYNALRETFRIKLDRALAVLEVWKVRAQAAQTHNQNVVEIFKAEYIAVQQSVETYKALMDGARVRAAVIEAQLGAYRTDVQAFSEQVGAEKIRVDAQDTRARAAIASNQNEIEVFKAKLAGQQQEIETFKALMEGARVRAALIQSKLDAYRTDVQVYSEGVSAEKVKIDANDSLTRSVLASNQNAVEIYKAKYAGVQHSVDVFKALMDGARTEASIVETQFNAYKADVQAFAERVSAEKTKFDVYESQVKGETAKANLFDVQSRTYASTVQAISSKAEVKMRGKQLNLEAARVKLAKFQGDVDIWKAHVDTEMRRSANEVQTFQAQTEAWRAGAMVNVAHAESVSRFADLQTRTNISFAEMQMTEFNAKMQQAYHQAQIALESAKAMGQYSAQLVAGAMSAINVSAQVQGQGTQTGSYSRQESYSYEGS